MHHLSYTNQFFLPQQQAPPCQGRGISSWSFMETTTENINQVYLSDFAAPLKKMRLIRKLTRQKAGLLSDFSFKNIERLENGRGAISVEKFKEFQEKYGCSDSEVEDHRTWKDPVIN